MCHFIAQVFEAMAKKNESSSLWPEKAGRLASTFELERRFSAASGSRIGRFAFHGLRDAAGSR